LAARLVKVDAIGLCNIVAGEMAVKELIQDDANPAAIAAEISAILGDAGYSGQIRSKLSQVRSRLGKGGASINVARLIPELIGAGR